MLISRIDFVNSDFESTSGIVKSITDREIDDTYSKKFYRPVSLKFKNFSGNEVNFIPFTENEWIQYLASSGTISSLMPVTHNTEETMNSLNGEITRIFVKGLSEVSYTSGAVCIIIQE